MPKHLDNSLSNRCSTRRVLPVTRHLIEDIRGNNDRVDGFAVDHDGELLVLFVHVGEMKIEFCSIDVKTKEMLSRVKSHLCEENSS